MRVATCSASCRAWWSSMSDQSTQPTATMHSRDRHGQTGADRVRPSPRWLLVAGISRVFVSAFRYTVGRQIHYSTVTRY